MSNRILNCTTCNDNSPITFVADDSLIPLYGGIPAYYIIGLNSVGSIDESFISGTGFDGTVRTIKIQSDGKILVGGDFIGYDGTPSIFIIRLNSDGSIDDTFDIGSGFSWIVRTIDIQSDGKILVGGQFATYDGTSSNYIIRLNSDGSIDNTFDIGGGFNSSVYTIQIQIDGKILVGGTFIGYDGTPSSGIIRLNSDGSIDNTFVIGNGFDNWVNTIQVQSDGKILAGGAFTSYSGTVSNYIIRLNSDGSIDNTFEIGDGFDGVVNTIVLQSDEKILVGGDFSNYDSITSKRIIRLNSDGSIDNTFEIGDGFDTAVYTIQIQSDGKILVGGGFTDYDGIPSNRIIRLNSDGSIDNTFVNGNGFDDIVYTIEIQTDGKILVGGGFSEYDTAPSSRIIRLNSDGSIDNTFVIGTGFDISVNTIQIQPDEKILVGGAFSSYPLNSGVFQLREGNCVSIDSYGVVSRNQPERLITFGPFISCIECSTPDDSAGVESIICISCDDVYSVTATTVPHAIYLNNQGRAISQINTVGIGGFNGLNN